MLPVRVREEVEADLRSLRVAARHEVLKRLATLRFAPDEGQVLRSGLSGEPVRVLHVGRYRVFYRVLASVEEAEHVLVLAVLGRAAQGDAYQVFAKREEEAAGAASSEQRDIVGQHGAAQAPPEADVFLSYASNDSAELAREVANALRHRGVKVWFDQYELRPGDSITERINEGFAASRFALVILSPAFFEERWARHELDLVLEREAQGQRVILPVWHGASHQLVSENAPLIADRVSLDADSLSTDANC
ncbi:MAG TPA: TIR domain-containing protein [Solirubrobacteraceae bacterium]|jgi:mRNA-degrading endonuclease RelE of RelBE toxin-antitoxin system